MWFIRFIEKLGVQDFTHVFKKPQKINKTIRLCCRAHVSGSCRNQNGSKMSQEFAHIPEIYERLYISDLAYGKHLLSKRIFLNDFVHNNFEIDFIINLSGTQLPKSDGTKISHIPIPDDRRLRYHDFCRFVRRFRCVLDKAIADDKKILVLCQAGTTRSASCVISYALHNQRLCGPEDNQRPLRVESAALVDYYVRYIENRQLNSGHEHWDTLTNQTFLKHLRLESEGILHFHPL